MRETIRDIDRLRHIDECIEHINDYLWRDIVDMRNALVHGYITTNASLVWDTYTNDLPSLKNKIVQYLEELKNNV